MLFKYLVIVYSCEPTALAQWFSTWGEFPPRGEFGHFRRRGNLDFEKFTKFVDGFGALASYMYVHIYKSSS